MVISKTNQFSLARKNGSDTGVGSPFPPGKGSMPNSGLQTVFSITHPLITHITIICAIRDMAFSERRFDRCSRMGYEPNRRLCFDCGYFGNL